MERTRKGLPVAVFLVEEKIWRMFQAGANCLAIAMSAGHEAWRLIFPVARKKGRLTIDEGKAGMAGLSVSEVQKLKSAGASGDGPEKLKSQEATQQWSERHRRGKVDKGRWGYWGVKDLGRLAEEAGHPASGRWGLVSTCPSALEMWPHCA